MISTSAIPVHIVQGTLGSGKSTVINRLLESAPPDEKWAVLVNEFGRVAIDPGSFSNSKTPSGGLIVRDSRSGCICCSGSRDLAGNLYELSHAIRPDRIIIEPMGLSDPATLRNQVAGLERDFGIALASTIAVLDMRLVGHHRFREMPFLTTLIEHSDYVYGSRDDLVSQDTRCRYEDRIGDLADRYHSIQVAHQNSLLI